MGLSIKYMCALRKFRGCRIVGNLDRDRDRDRIYSPILCCSVQSRSCDWVRMAVHRPRAFLWASLLD